LAAAEPGATFLVNAPFGPDEMWSHLPRQVQQTIIDKQLKFYVIDAYSVAREAGMGNRINTIMQTCFFAISGVLPREEAIAAIKKAIEETYGKRGQAVVQKNFTAVDQALSRLYQVKVPEKVSATFEMLPPVPARAPAFVREVIGTIISGNGDALPVSAIPNDGTFPTATAQWEKRNLAQQIPVWDTELCIQCGKCVLVCPHAAIRAKVYDPSHLAKAPATFKSAKPRWREYESLRYTLQVAPEDCTGCRLCVEICPAKSKSEVKHRSEEPRLNSSHRTISYAVFCLKKKTKNKVLDIALKTMTVPTHYVSNILALLTHVPQHPYERLLIIDPALLFRCICSDERLFFTR